MAEVWEERAADWLAWVRTPGKDASRAVVEAARVLTGSGHLCVCVTHPFADAGERGEDGRFAVTRPYLQGGPLQASVERDGLRIEFEGSRTRSSTTPKRCRTQGSSSNPRASRVATHAGRSSPMFLMLRCRKR